MLSRNVGFNLSAPRSPDACLQGQKEKEGEEEGEEEEEAD